MGLLSNPFWNLGPIRVPVEEPLLGFFLLYFMAADAEDILGAPQSLQLSMWQVDVSGIIHGVARDVRLLRLGFWVLVVVGCLLSRPANTRNPPSAKPEVPTVRALDTCKVPLHVELLQPQFQELLEFFST